MSPAMRPVTDRMLHVEVWRDPPPWWERMRCLVLTTEERQALRGEPARSPDGHALATLASVALVERGGRFAVWTVLGKDGAAIGDVRRHYARRPASATVSLRAVCSAVGEVQRVERRWLRRYPGGAYASLVSGGAT